MFVGNSDVSTAAGVYGYAFVYAHALAQRDADSHPIAITDSDINSYAHSYAHSYANLYTDTHTYTHSDSFSHAYAHAHAYSNTHFHPHAKV